MYFNVDKVREFLLENGIVYTLRRKRKRVGYDYAFHGSYYKKVKLARIEIDEIKRIKSWIDLIPYVGRSGLMHLAEGPILCAEKWFELAKKLSGDNLYLYRVTVLWKIKEEK